MIVMLMIGVLALQYDHAALDGHNFPQREGVKAA